MIVKTNPILTSLSQPSPKADLKELGNIGRAEKSAPTTASDSQMEAKEKMQKAARDFEALLIGEMFKVMRKSIHKSELTKSGFGEEMFESILDGKISENLAKRDMLGIAKMLERELLGKLNGSSSQERLQMPVLGKITSNFGMRTHPITHKETHHDGVDISLKEGTPIKASLGGKVVFSGEKGGYGNVIIVKTGDYETLYAHCSELLFEKGDNIKQGERIALSGNTGRSTGPHLHFEVRHKGKAVDPFSIIKK